MEGEHIDKPISEVGNLGEKYYANYDSLFTMEMFSQRIEQAAVPEAALEAIRTKEGKATFLVLGSATPDNLNGIAKIVHRLHSKEAASGDDVYIIDINKTSVDIHQKAVADLDERSEWSGKTIREQAGAEFPYPRFAIEQGDMRNIPHPDKSIDVVLSDYTFNYLDSVDSIVRALGEIHRILSEEGLSFITLRFSSESESQIIDQGGFSICKFPLQTYLDAADKAGLEIVNPQEIGRYSDELLVCKRKRTLN